MKIKLEQQKQKEQRVYQQDPKKVESDINTLERKKLLYREEEQ